MCSSRSPRSARRVSCVTTSKRFFSVAREIQQKIDNYIAGLGIEVAGRLVGKNDIRIVRQSAGNGNALLLATRKLGRQMLHPVSQANCRQTFFRCFGCQSSANHPGQRNIFQRRQFRQQEISLENETHFLVAKARLRSRTAVVEIAALKFHRARFRSLQASQRVNQSCFPRSGRAANKNDLAMRNFVSRFHAALRSVVDPSGTIGTSRGQLTVAARATICR